MLTIPAKIIAASFALICFAAAAAVALVAGNSLSAVLWKATVVMVVCYGVGRIAGGVAQQTVQDHIKQYQETHPIPDENDLSVNQEHDDDVPAPSEEARSQMGSNATTDT